MLHSFGLLIAVTLVVVCHMTAIDVHAETPEFDTLSDEQKGAAMALLKQAMSETKIDPLELIRKGMEKVKEEQERQMMGDEPQPRFHATSTTVQPSEAPSPFSNEQSENIVPASEQSSTAKSGFGESETVGTATAGTTTIVPDVASSTPTAVTDPVDTAEPATDTPTDNKPQPSSSEVPAVNSEQPQGFTSTFTSVTSTTSTPSSQSPQTQSSSSSSTTSSVDGSQSDQQSKANDAGSSSADPSNQEMEETYIDNSDPNDPKRVHVKNISKSTIDDNGFSHERQESVSSTSLGNNPNSFSHHSSSFSSSASGHVNGKPVKPINWSYNKIPYATIPPIPKLPTLPALPAMPTLPPLPMLPYGAWPGYYGQNYEDLGRYPGQTTAFASAYTGIPENFFGYPNAPYMSRRQAKRIAKKQERAARRAREYEYES